MPRVIGMHDVDDVEHWLASPKRDKIFKDVAVDMVTFVHLSEPNKVGLSANISDLEKLLEINNSPLGCSTGMSFIECTAMSMEPSNNASSISRVNRPLPPISLSGRS